MHKKLLIFLILALILGLGVFFVYEKQETVIKEVSQETVIKEVSIVEVNPDKKICDGKGNCITGAEYNAYLNSPDYLCKYYQKSIWKESEREYGKKQYRYTEEKLKKIKTLKEEGKALCDAGKFKEGENKLIEAITMISFTMLK